MTKRKPASRAAVPWGGFEILEQAGEGGMGGVYRVQQNFVDCAVALKILNPGLIADAAYVEAFRREARAGEPSAPQHCQGE